MEVIVIGLCNSIINDQVLLLFYEISHPKVHGYDYDLVQVNAQPVYPINT